MQDALPGLPPTAPALAVLPAVLPAILLLLLWRELHADLARGHHALHERHGASARANLLLLSTVMRLLLLLRRLAERLLLNELRWLRLPESVRRRRLLRLAVHAYQRSLLLAEVGGRLHWLLRLLLRRLRECWAVAGRCLAVEGLLPAGGTHAGEGVLLLEARERRKSWCEGSR